MTGSWHVHDLHMNCSLLAHDIAVSTSSWHICMTCSSLVLGLFMICSWHFHNLLMTSSQLLMTCSWLIIYSFLVLNKISLLTNLIKDVFRQVSVDKNICHFELKWHCLKRNIFCWQEINVIQSCLYIYCREIYNFEKNSCWLEFCWKEKNVLQIWKYCCY